MALWEISLSTNKAGAWRRRLTSPAPGRGGCSVNKLAVALTARELTATQWKLHRPERHASRRAVSLFAIPPLTLLCFLGESKLEPLTSEAQVKERGRREKEEEKSFISCASGSELHLELIAPASPSHFGRQRGRREPGAQRGCERPPKAGPGSGGSVHSQASPASGEGR